MNQTDYEIFTARIKDFGGELVQVIGKLPGVKARYEAWWTPKAGGFVLGVDEITNQIGVYEFVGIKGAPVSHDIEWLERKHERCSLCGHTDNAHPDGGGCNRCPCPGESRGGAAD